ncbi:hypothetical protein PC9H_007328 [Pleurotus ostreatus]|uniref:Protein kinase domain-containing protein n=2 Tax=Pleurotus ostreatus TaxID=5322 RepID=A0A8H6ZT77_PLEOS|nr:uncharacterized protein PC9H_007328 [Pleurotus ostreatus]KAF7428109.1 hypothetical protein PC9H_007328 [Pleurotus ostreatus]KAJ8696168.1 hypothetical protein PTI98_006057 [Pleurotus ostreatus]
MDGYHLSDPRQLAAMHVKRITLTSKKNWWMVEMDQDDPIPQPPPDSAHPAQARPHPLPHPHALSHSLSHSHSHSHSQHPRSTYPSDLTLRSQITQLQAITPPPSPPIYNPPRHPTSIFSFPTPTAYCAPPNPTAALSPFAQGSASELFKCIVKKPDVVQLEINGEMQSNASDVTVQFLAELRVYTTLHRHRNICAFLGSLENVGMVLEFIDGRTLYDVVIHRPFLTPHKKIDYHNQLLDGLTHLHSYGLSHGDLSLLNVQVTHSSDTIKLLDFGRSVASDSIFKSPEEEPVDPFAYLPQSSSSNPNHHTHNQNHNSASSSTSNLLTPTTPTQTTSTRIEQIHPGTRPFSAPEILRAECQDPLLADAYSFGILLICLDYCESVDVKPWEQRKDKGVSKLVDGLRCNGKGGGGGQEEEGGGENIYVFGERVGEYLRKWDEGRRRLRREDMMSVPMDVS